MKTKLIEYWEGFSKNPSQNLKRLLPVENDELYPMQLFPNGHLGLKLQ